MECERCKSNSGTDENHTCPFAEEINGDYEANCNCCEECYHECCMDI